MPRRRLVGSCRVALIAAAVAASGSLDGMETPRAIGFVESNGWTFVGEIGHAATQVVLLKRLPKS